MRLGAGTRPASARRSAGPAAFVLVSVAIECFSVCLRMLFCCCLLWDGTGRAAPWRPLYFSLVSRSFWWVVDMCKGDESLEHRSSGFVPITIAIFPTD